MVAEETLKAVLAAVGTQAITIDPPDNALRYTKRRWKDAEIYLFFNESAAPFSHIITFLDKLTHIEAWDAQTGTVADVSIIEPGKVALQLKPYEARILVVH